MQFLSPDSGFMRGLSDAIDAIWINILMLVCSIPLFTIGAALSAGFDAARRDLDGVGHVTANYLRAFKDNFVKATLIWLVFGSTLAALVYAWVVLQITPLLIVKFALTIIWVIGFEWVWALQARFENDPGHTMLNAWIFGLSNIGRTLALVGMDLVYLALVAASWVYMPQGLFLLIILGYGTLIMLHTPVLEGVFVRYVGKATASEGLDPSREASAGVDGIPDRD